MIIIISQLGPRAEQRSLRIVPLLLVLCNPLFIRFSQLEIYVSVRQINNLMNKILNLNVTKLNRKLYFMFLLLVNLCLCSTKVFAFWCVSMTHKKYIMRLVSSFFIRYALLKIHMFRKFGMCIISARY